MMFENVAIAPTETTKLVIIGQCGCCGQHSYLVGTPVLRLHPGILEWRKVQDLEVGDRVWLKLDNHCSNSYEVVDRGEEFVDILDWEQGGGCERDRSLCWECFDGAITPGDRQYLRDFVPLKWNEEYPWSKAKFCCSKGEGVDYGS